MNAIYSLTGILFCLAVFHDARSNDAKQSIKWLIENRQSDHGWGKETPRALVALHLAGHDGDDKELMSKQLQVELACHLARSNKKEIASSELALYIHALLTVCESPKDFHGIDLLNKLNNAIAEDANPLVALALCNAGQELNDNIIRQLTTVENIQIFPFWMDNYALGLMALSCANKTRNIGSHLSQMAKTLIDHQNKDDGSFGNVYTTSLVAQAISASGSRDSWNKTGAKNYIMSHRLKDGSFGDMLATYLALPVLKDTNLVALSSNDCQNEKDGLLSVPQLLNKPGTKINVHYSLWFGESRELVTTISLLVPSQLKFFDVMRIAAVQDQRFLFNYKKDKNAPGKILVHSLMNVSNDPENGLYWMLHLQDDEQRRKEALRQWAEHERRHEEEIKRREEERRQDHVRRQEHEIKRHEERIRNELSRKHGQVQSRISGNLSTHEIHRQRGTRGIHPPEIERQKLNVILIQESVDAVSLQDNMNIIYWYKSIF